MNKTPSIAIFKHVVSAHFATLSDADYVRPLLLRCGSLADTRCVMTLRDAFAHDIAFPVWINDHVANTNLSMTEWLRFVGDAVEEIGRVGEEPVYFSRAAGIYGCVDPEYPAGMIELWLTSPHYPPGW